MYTKFGCGSCQVNSHLSDRFNRHSLLSKTVSTPLLPTFHTNSVVWAGLGPKRHEHESRAVCSIHIISSYEGHTSTPEAAQMVGVVVVSTTSND